METGLISNQKTGLGQKKNQKKGSGWAAEPRSLEDDSEEKLSLGKAYLHRWLRGLKAVNAQESLYSQGDPIMRS